MKKKLIIASVVTVAVATGVALISKAVKKRKQKEQEGRYVETHMSRN